MAVAQWTNGQPSLEKTPHLAPRAQGVSRKRKEWRVLRCLRLELGHNFPKFRERKLTDELPRPHTALAGGRQPAQCRQACQESASQ